MPELTKEFEGYPRGVIHPVDLGVPNIKAKHIELKHPGVVFINAKEFTVFIPYHRIAYIVYEDVPQEVKHARAN